MFFMCAPVAIFMVSGRGGRLQQLKLHQSEIVSRGVAEKTPGRLRLGLERTGEPIRAAPPVFLSSLRVFRVL